MSKTIIYYNGEYTFEKLWAEVLEFTPKGKEVEIHKIIQPYDLFTKTESFKLTVL